MSSAKGCDACGTFTVEKRRRGTKWVSLRLPSEGVAPAGHPLEFDWGESWDACSPACLHTLADRWRDREATAILEEQQ